MNDEVIKMRKPKIMIPAIVAAVAVAGLLSASVVLALPSAHKASGGGTLDLSVVGEGVATLGFNAKIDTAGTTTGQGSLNIDTLGKAKLIITCLDVVGNVAYLTGVPTRSTIPFFPVGFPVEIQMLDGGEGVGTVDLIGVGAPVFAAPPCGANPGFLTVLPLPWTNGNIQVK